MDMCRVCPYHIPWRSRKYRACPVFQKGETRGPGWVYLGVQVLPKLVCGRFMIYIYCYKKPHVCNMHSEAALRQPLRSLFFSLELPYRVYPV